MNTNAMSVSLLSRVREIPGAPGYDVTDTGRVFSRWERIHLGRYGSRVQVGIASRELAQFDRMLLSGKPSGYRSVKVGPTNRYVHELVLVTFVGPRPSPDHEVCHGNGAREDNRLENLRWGTTKENWRDRVDAGTQFDLKEWNTGVHAFSDLLLESGT